MRTFRFPEVVPHFNSNATVANCESSVCNNYGMTPVVDRVPFEMEFDTHAAAPTKALYVNEKESTRLDGQTAIDASVPNVSVPPDGNCFYIVGGNTDVNQNPSGASATFGRFCFAPAAPTAAPAPTTPAAPTNAALVM